MAKFQRISFECLNDKKHIADRYQCNTIHLSVFVQSFKIKSDSRMINDKKLNDNSRRSREFLSAIIGDDAF